MVSYKKLGLCRNQGLDFGAAICYKNVGRWFSAVASLSDLVDHQSADHWLATAGFVFVPQVCYLESGNNNVCFRALLCHKM